MVNTMILQGRLTADPEIKETSEGTKYARFTVAWSEKYKERETSCFLNCTAWRGTAEFLEKYFHKGQELVISGRLETQKWVDNDGNNRSAISCNIQTVSFCGSKADKQAKQTSPTGVDVATGEVTDEFFELSGDEDLPF